MLVDAGVGNNHRRDGQGLGAVPAHPRLGWSPWASASHRLGDRHRRSPQWHRPRRSRPAWNKPGLALLVLAIRAGSLFGHVNDAGFWLVGEYFGMTVGETIKVVALMERSSPSPA